MASSSAQASSSRPPGRGKRLHRRPTPPPSDPDSSSSSSSEEEPALHPWLRFETLAHTERLITHMGRSFYESRTLSWPVLEELQLAARAGEMLSEPWLRFFAIREPVYRVLCLEFLSTVHLHTPVLRLDYDRTLTFRLGGEARQLSLAQFATRMGLYTPEELGTQLFTGAHLDFPEGVTAAGYWPNIGDNDFDPRRTKSTSIRDPLVRILHRAIAHSICGRKDSTGVVTSRDMFPLFCFTAPATGNVAYRLASYLSRVATKRPFGPICAGTYITRLARSYGTILTAERLPALDRLHTPGLIDIPVLLHMEVIQERDGGGYQLLDGQGHPWPPVHPAALMDPGGRGRGAGDDAGIGRGRGDGGGRGDPQQLYARTVSLATFRRFERRQERRWQWMSSMMSDIAAAHGIEPHPLPQDSDDE